MTIFLLALSMLLAYATIVLPVREAKRARSKQAFDDTYRAFQLYYIKKHYPEVEDLSFEEIKGKFNIRSAYNSLSIKN